MFHLDVYPREGDAIAEAAEGVVIGRRLYHDELLEEMGTEAVAALVGVVVVEVVVRGLAQHGRTIGVAFARGDVARSIGNLPMKLILACTTELHRTAHHLAIAGIVKSVQ